MKETLDKKHCLRCDHRWFPRKQGRPTQCSSCHSPRWDMEPVQSNSGENHWTKKGKK